MRIEDKMKRRSQEDQIDIGMVAERITMGEAGTLFKCICEGIKEEYLMKADEDSHISPDRTLGVITGINKLQERLDQCVDIKMQLISERKEAAKVKSGEAPQG